MPKQATTTTMFAAAFFGTANLNIAASAQPAATPTSPQRTISRAAPTRDEQACLQAVNRTTNNPEVQLMTGTETSEANNTVYIGVGANLAIWRCLVKNGTVAEVMSMTNEGHL